MEANFNSKYKVRLKRYIIYSEHDTIWLFCYKRILPPTIGDREIYALSNSGNMSY